MVHHIKGVREDNNAPGARLLPINAPTAPASAGTT